MKISILLPTFNRSDILMKTIESVRAQKFSDYEILVWDDCSHDDTGERVLGIEDDRISYHKNGRNLGYARNLQACYEHAGGEIIFLLADDDLLLDDALSKTHNGFLRGEHIGLVTRPYYWFWDDPRIPIRAVQPYDPESDSEISIFDGPRATKALFQSAGQLSGLAFRRKYMDTPFHEDIFPSHIYPFTSILRKYKAVFLKDFTIAVRTPLSISTHRSDTYDISPVGSWVKMFDSLLSSPDARALRDDCVSFIIEDTYNGLLQIKTATFSTSKVLREIRVILMYHPQTVVQFRFYFYSLIAIVAPGRVLRAVIDWYKRNLLSRQTAEEILRTRVDYRFGR